MNWKYHQPHFDYELDEFPVSDLSAWTGHRRFVYDLIRTSNPKSIVELGTHAGCSLFSMAQAVKDGQIDSELYAVDTWQGDKHSDHYDSKIYSEVERLKNEFYPDVAIELIKTTFDKAASKFDDGTIDLLHIDGLHTYQAVKHDFNNWFDKITDSGIILLHDIHEKQDNFGVYRLWDELKKDFSTIEFFHAHGLGVLFKDKQQEVVDLRFESIWQKYYQQTEQINQLKTQLNKKLLILEKLRNKGFDSNQFELNSDEIETEFKGLSKRNRELEKEIVLLKEEAGRLKQLLQNAKNHTSNLEDFYRQITTSKTFKMWQRFNKIKKFFKLYFLQGKLIKLAGKTLTILLSAGPVSALRKIKHFLLHSHRQTSEALNEQYQGWIKLNYPSKSQLSAQRIWQEQFDYRPKISVIVPTFNTQQEWLKTCLDSVLNQTYDNWELCIADDASTEPHVKQVLGEYKKRDNRIKVVYREENGHICQASNSALKLADGEFIALLDHDDELKPHALFEVVKLLNKHPNADMIYSDEDKKDPDGKYVDPHFKPDWAPDMFLSLMYTCHLGVYRKKLVDELGGFRPNFEGSQDYDLVLRITELTDEIYHIPDILYTWRKVPGSTADAGKKAKPYAYEAAKKALNAAMVRRNVDAQALDGPVEGLYRMKYQINKQAKVSIIIPNKNKLDYFQQCVRSILSKSSYENYEIIVVDTGSKEEGVLRYYDRLKKRNNIKIIYWEREFNFSEVNNYGVQQAEGEYLVFLNNDTEVISPDWIESMLEHAQRPKIGAVGAKLYFANKEVQHAGVVLGMGEHRIAGHAFYHARGLGCFGYIDIIRNYSAVTGACLMVSREKFKEINGFDSKLIISFNDVDLCLKLMKAGYRNIYTPYAQLFHYESASLGKVEHKARLINQQEVEYMKDKWDKLLENDPFYNPNLSLDHPDFRIKPELTG